MKKGQFLIFALYVGIQSFLLQLIDQLIGTHLTSGGHSGFVFIAFQGWALYFLLGSNLKGAVKGLLGYILGILFAVIMIILSNIFAGAGILAVPIVALIVVPFMMYFEFAPWCISNVSVFFIGAGAFFGVMNYVEGVTKLCAAGIVLLYCTLGLASGWMSILFRNRLEEICWKKKEAKEEYQSYE
ncbi:MAG: DUF1097 domain-containing protein [Hespellia sp.]|nr:DUF1097 domain-containing protein [Hespellia sp.]